MKNVGESALQRLMGLLNSDLSHRIKDTDEIDNDLVLQLFNQAGGLLSSSFTNNDAPIGTIISYMGTVVPDGYLACDGTTYHITEYPALAKHIETNFGSVDHFGGDGENTFAVPNLSGRFMLNSSESHDVGDTGGTEAVTLDVSQLPQHNHYLYRRYGEDAKIFVINSADALAGTGGTQSRLVMGGNMISGLTGQAHENMPPYMTVLYCIKAVTSESSISEYDTDDGWHVRKYPDGYVEMIGNFQLSIPNNWSGAVINGPRYNDNAIPTYKYPVQLYTRYSEILTFNRETGGRTIFPILISLDRTMKTTGRYSVGCLWSIDEASETKLNFHITGRWK